MHNTISYAGIADRHMKDAEAYRDLVDWLSPIQLSHIESLGSIQHINIALSFAGVSGYPFHAFCRTRRLKEYRAWMHDGSDAVPTDEEGYPIEN